MSARVLNPIVLSEFCKLRSPSTVSRTMPSSRKLNKIKRDLFGVANPVETKKIFEEEIGKQQEIATKKWGFDFRSGFPLSSSNQYCWERVSFPDFIPEMYTLTRAAHVRETEPAETVEDVLMDERAAKENPSMAIDDIINALDENSSLFKVPGRSSISELSCRKSIGKRQPKITEYMKERKRLAATPKKVSPAKRHRSSLYSSPHGSSLHRKL